MHAVAAPTTSSPAENSSLSNTSSAMNSPQASDRFADREVRYEYTRNLTPLLEKLGCSLMVSTYQAGKVVTVGTGNRGLDLSFHNFDRPMGVAINRKRGMIAVAARNQVWFLKNNPDIAPRLAPAGSHDACFLTQSSQVTGEIQAHELGYADDELWVVNTAFSCLCTLDPNYSFVPRWRPPFISDLAAEDRCHLNGMAMDGGKPKYVTAMSQTDTAAGWRETKAHSGCVIDVANGDILTEGFAMPHSPRVYRNAVWVLDSGRGSLVRVDPTNGAKETVSTVPGYARGLAFHDRFAFIGLSKIRETSTFDGVPIAEDRSRLKCGVAVIDIDAGKMLGLLSFEAGVDEIFDVTVLPNLRAAAMRGPFATQDGLPAIWAVPQPASSTASNN